MTSASKMGGGGGPEKPFGALAKCSSCMVVGDNLGPYYSAVADDSSQASKKREAAMLFTAAESALDNGEDPKQAEQTAMEALAISRKLEDLDALADTLRLVIRAYCLQADVASYEEGQGDSDTAKACLAKADQLAKDELGSFCRKNHQKGEAAMQLAVAEVQLAKRTYHARQLAFEAATTAQTLYSRIGDKKMEATTLLTMVPVHVANREKGKAEEAAEKALALFKGSGDKLGEAKALRELATARGVGSTYMAINEAIKSARDAAALFQQLDHKKASASATLSIAQWCLDIDEPQKAIPAARDALGALQELGQDRGSLGAAWSILAQAHVMQEQAGQALHLVNEAYAHFQKTGDKKQEVVAEHLQAYVHMVKGAKEEALRAAQASVATSQDLNDRALEAWSLLVLCQCKIEMQDFQGALQDAQEAATIFTFLDDMDEEMGLAQCFIGDLYYMLGKYSHGRGAVQRALDRFEKERSKHGQILALTVLVGIEEAMKTERKKDDFQKIIDHATQQCQEMQDVRAEAGVHEYATDLFLFLGKPSKALVHAKQRRELLRDAGFRIKEMRAMHMCAFVLNQTDDVVEAGRMSREGLRFSRTTGDKTMEVQMMIQVIVANSAIMMTALDEKTMKNTSDETVKLARDAVTLARKVGEGAVRGPALFWLARVLLLTQGEEPMRMANEALALFRKDQQKGPEASTLLLVAQIHYSLGEREQAITIANQAMAIFQDVGDSKGTSLVEELIQMLAPKQMQMFQDVIDEGAVAAVSAAVVPVKKGLNPADVKIKLRDMVRELIATDTVEIDTPLMDSGVDSLSSVQFRNDVAKEFQTNLPASLIFDYPNLGSLTEYLVEHVN
mmetsp:Transcript_47362/g.133640  ORF Transcript_47362/g.133640 Transcript_47362/m.133640 type:complete len:849 (-) Transcript_47362:62-2608(-)|eukprot:CAMPEP_0179234104 /NCGR_PEP_ID=MMETSP0797-20121207/12718_1 /TAXON_ID=47934 /ORGANISM="Dinophysis acuminata, Strain DAEP01" /LENGTH=848 /DNA_ID=CAMNT_0020941275 /DNA_START=98 /DNA_END=2644 /DNA_ORIENTATION=+